MATTYFWDQFTGTASTNLDSHTPDTGTSWVKRSADATNLMLSDANRARLGGSVSWGSADFEATLTGTPGSTWQITAKFYVASVMDGGWTIKINHDYGSPANGYTISYDRAAGSYERIRIYRVDAGTPNLLAYPDVTWTATETHTIVVERNGNTLNVKLDGSQIFTSTQTSYVSTKRCGLSASAASYGSNANGIHFDDFAVQDLGDTYPPVVGGTTFYLLNTATGDGWGDVQMGGSAPATATTSTGWTVGTTALGNYSQMAFGSERTSATFAGTAKPGTAPDNSLKDAYRLGPYTGSFAAGDWTVSVPVIAVDQQGGAGGKCYVRVFKSANADGSSSSEVTSGAVALSTVTNLTTSAAQTSSGTVTLGAITLTNEYLFFCLAWYISTAAT